MRYVFFLFLWLIASTSWACEHPADYVSIAERPSKTLLYELTGCGIETSYIFGTFHSDSPKLTPILKALEPYIEQTERLWLEIVATNTGQRKVQQLLSLPASSANLSDIIGEELFEKTYATFGPILKLSRPVMERFQPWALAILVQYPPAENDGIVLDQKLQFFASRKAIPSASLEDLDAQFGIFLDMPEQMQLNFLKSTLDDMDELPATLNELESNYLKGDINAIHALSRKLFDDLAKSYPDLARYLESELIDKRNLRMAQKAADEFKRPIFIAVGALHLPGETGMLQLLESTGLQIRPIPVP